MKRITLSALVAVLVLSSCSFESYNTGCPAYSQQNKTTKHGQQAQVKYAKKNLREKI